MIDKLQIATSYLTKRKIEGKHETEDLDSASLAEVIWLFPVVGFGIGGLGAIALFALTWVGIPAAVSAIISIGFVIWLTLAKHEKELGFLADELSNSDLVENNLEVERRDRLRPYGVLCLAIMTVTRIATVASIAHVDIGAAAAALIAANCWSRSMFASIMRWLPIMDHKENLISGIMPSEGETWKSLALGCLLSTLLLLTPAGGGLIIILAAGGLASFAVGWLSLRKIEGYTEEVLGGTQQAAETATLVIASAVIMGKIV